MSGALLTATLTAAATLGPIKQINAGVLNIRDRRRLAVGPERAPDPGSRLSSGPATFKCRTAW